MMSITGYNDQSQNQVGTRYLSNSQQKPDRGYWILGIFSQFLELPEQTAETAALEGLALLNSARFE